MKKLTMQDRIDQLISVDYLLDKAKKEKDKKRHKKQKRHYIYHLSAFIKI